MRIDRDRDPVGRARNARPRDALGRPLPWGTEGVARVPDDLVLEPEPALAEAQRLLDQDLPFHAHEVLEGTWKSAPADERDLWQGLAQLAVGLTHLRRGNAVGAATLLARGRRRIAPYGSAPPYGIDVAGLLDWVDATLVSVEAPDPAAAQSVRPPRLLRLAEPVTEGGEPVCWLDRVCPNCGRLSEDRAIAVCPECGSELPDRS